MKTIPGNTLTASEKQELKECELIVKRGLNTFQDVGDALHRIRDGKLYRATHKTFEAYVIQTFNFSRGRASHLIAAAKTAENLSTTVDISKVNERSLRPLAGLTPATQRIAFAQAAEDAGGSPDSADVEAAMDRMIQKAFDDLPAEDQVEIMRRDRKKKAQQAQVRVNKVEAEKRLSLGNGYGDRERKNAVTQRNDRDAGILDEGGRLEEFIKLIDKAHAIYATFRVR